MPTIQGIRKIDRYWFEVWLIRDDGRVEMRRFLTTSLRKARQLAEEWANIIGATG